MSKKIFKLFTLLLIFSLAVPFPVFAQPRALPASPVTFTILHTNDFHGQLEPSGSNPGLARTAAAINAVRSTVGAENVLLLDAGDEMQGSLLSNLWQGVPVIDAFNLMGYDAATFGNHEFDWGQEVLADRVGEADYPYLAANLVVKDAATCEASGWTSPAFAQPYTILEVGTAPNTVKVGVIGVTSTETPTITIASATDGLCFKDPYASILQYYAYLKANSDVLVVLSHLGFEDGGYGYGIPVYGDKTLASKLNTAGKPVNLIIGGHSHTNLSAATVVGTTVIGQAYYNGRNVGRADITVTPAGAVSITWSRISVSTSGAQDSAVNTIISEYVSDPDYQALINLPIGYSQVDLLRNYNGDAMMGDFVDDSIYYALNNDGTPENDVDMFFNNAGGIRIDWCDKEDPLNSGTYIWSSSAADCQAEGLWTHDPMLLNYGQMFQILPFGNATIVGDMTGAQIIDLLNQSATLFKGALQPAGMRYSFFRYSDALPGPQPYAWGAYDICVIDKVTGDCNPIDPYETYRVGTNEFLAPAGQDGYVPFKYMTNISYWGDMLNAVNAWVSANYTKDNPYKGPDGDGTLDGRITRNGTDAGGSIVPLTILHHNDSHGNLVKGSYVAYPALAARIKQERAHNPNRTLLLSSGDNIQGDGLSFFFKTAPTGYAADGTALAPELQIQPIIKAFNTMSYDAMVLGNHEFNFGKDVFTSVLSQATFPILQANLVDDGSYGIASVPVLPSIEKTVGPEGIKVAILGIGNHRVPNYELPSNIPGLSFPNPLSTANDYINGPVDDLRATNDVVIALTHIGFTANPASVEIDENVDTVLADQVPGIDAIIGGHSHTSAISGFGAYKYLPAIVAGPTEPVIVTQAYRYNNTLGEVILGLRAKSEGGYEVVSRAGRYITVALADPEDAEMVNLLAPYASVFATYNNTEIGQTTAPLDALQAFTQETTGANLQADAAVYELEEKNGIPVDFHLSGAMTNKAVAGSATPASPVKLKIADMFTVMPYENSLVVLNMNGPQLKAVLERAYRNYYYYKYVPGYGGYSYYTTCMIDINAGGEIVYNDLYADPYDPNVNHVVSLKFGDTEVDFDDADTYYRVSTVNYLAAGSCNFNDGGVSLWPLGQIANDTQFYVRDAVVDYIKAMGTVSPAIEGRLKFIYDVTAPVITIASPEAKFYDVTDPVVVDFAVTDDVSGVKAVYATLNGVPVVDGQVIDISMLEKGDNVLLVEAEDKAGNISNASVTFQFDITIDGLIETVETYVYRKNIKKVLINTLEMIQRDLDRGKILQARLKMWTFIAQVRAYTPKFIDRDVSRMLIEYAIWWLKTMPKVHGHW